MEFRQIFVVTFLLVLGVVVAQNQVERQLACIIPKYNASLGQSFSECYQRKQSTQIVKIKQCHVDIMKTQNIVKRQGEGQGMVVDREALRNYATANNHDVARAMMKVYNTTSASDDIYKKPPRLAQGVFEIMKQSCPTN